MWEQSKRDRFQWLRDREEAGTLHDTEKDELQGLIQEIEDAEAEYLVPATERLRRRTERIEAQSQALEDLIRQKEALLAKLQDLHAEVVAWRRAVDEQLGRRPAGSATGGSAVSD